MDWLDSLGVEYEEIDAENMDLKSVPVTEIDDIKIVGLDRPAIKRALKEKGIIKWKRISSLSMASAEVLLG